jgi:hypothetical protein
MVTSKAIRQCCGFPVFLIDVPSENIHIWWMLKYVLVTLSLFATQVHAEETRTSIGMTGIGQMTCSYWLSTASRRSEGAAWIFGFWTGLNYVAAASEQDQAKLGESQIIAEVKKTCDQQSSAPLATAVWSTFISNVTRAF